MRRHDGSLPDLSKNLFIIRNQFYSFGDKSVTSKEFELDRNGDAQIKLYIDKNECSFSLEVRFSKIFRSKKVSRQDLVRSLILKILL